MVGVRVVSLPPPKRGTGRDYLIGVGDVGLSVCGRGCKDAHAQLSCVVSLCCQRMPAAAVSRVVLVSRGAAPLYAVTPTSSNTKAPIRKFKGLENGLKVLPMPAAVCQSALKALVKSRFGSADRGATVCSDGGTKKAHMIQFGLGQSHWRRLPDLGGKTRDGRSAVYGAGSAIRSTDAAASRGAKVKFRLEILQVQREVEDVIIGKRQRWGGDWGGCKRCYRVAAACDKGSSYRQPRHQPENFGGRPLILQVAITFARNGALNASG